MGCKTQCCGSNSNQNDCNSAADVNLSATIPITTALDNGEDPFDRVEVGVAQPNGKTDLIVDDCCNVDDLGRRETREPGCCSAGVDSTRGDGGCCSSEPKISKTPVTCCSSKQSPEVKAFIHEHEGDRPPCCEGKSYPCCNESCIEEIALRECCDNSHSSDLGNSASSADCHEGAGNQKPCRTHLRKARSRYLARLEALGCICRALIALGQESCCSTRTRPSQVNRTSTRVRSRTRTSKDPRRSPAKTAAIISDKQNVEGVSREVQSFDPENIGSPNQEHVVLTITGMTCTGCETKLQRTLRSLASITNLKTSLILSRVEFDLNNRLSSVSEVIRHLERTTEFKCEQINFQTSNLDLIHSGDLDAILNAPWPSGVTAVNPINNGIIRVEFDARLVGARDLVQNGWNQPMQLAPPRTDPGLEAGNKHVRHMGLMTLLSVALTIPVLVMAWAPLPDREHVYASVSLAFATIIQVVVAGPFYPKALKSLIFSRVIEMDLLVVLSTSAAYIFSVVSFGYLIAGRPLSTGEFFETSTLLVTLIMVGRYISSLARQRAVESISIRSLQTSTATIVNDLGSETVIDTRLLQFGDVFRVKSESRIPTDGTVVSGNSEVDESMLTGESLPVQKCPGSVVIAGSINGSGTLTVRLTRLPSENTVSSIAAMVDEAKLSKPKIQEIADRVASYFVPVVLGLTIITFAVWIAVGSTVRGQTVREATIQAVTYAITVLIVSCPCAIGLAVPMVIVIATGIAAERGIIFKSSESIEVAYKTSHIVFDKTGTLTMGKLSVSEEKYICDHIGEVKSIVLGLLSQNNHPVSVAVATYLINSGVSPTEVSDSKTVPGKGIEGEIPGYTLRVGHTQWLDVADEPTVQWMLSRGLSVLSFTMNDSLAAVYGLEDTIRPEALSTVTEIQNRGITVHVLSGDDDGAVRNVSSRLGISNDNVRSRCSPADKQKYIQEIFEISDNSSVRPSECPIVIFCGDGTNDAVALAAATIGVHMNGGTDVAKSAADVVLVRQDLKKILTIIAISRIAIHRIWFNFGWSFVYNIFAISLASGAFVNVRIPPEYAGLGELASVLPVVVAAALMRWTKF